MDSSNNKSIFFKKHPIIVNLLAMGITFVALCLIAMFVLNVFTEHGQYKVVPNLKRMPIADAILRLESDGFKWEITDSTYNDAYPLGSVIEQDPKPDAHAKSLRTVYLSVNASSPRLVSVPSIVDTSVRQGESILQGLGFKNVTTVYVSSPYKDLVISVAANGRTIEPGTKLSPSARITLTVGNGIEKELPVDSLGDINQDSDFINEFENSDF